MEKERERDEIVLGADSPVTHTGSQLTRTSRTFQIKSLHRSKNPNHNYGHNTVIRNCREVQKGHTSHPTTTGRQTAGTPNNALRGRNRGERKDLITKACLILCHNNTQSHFWSLACFPRPHGTGT